MGLLSFKIQGVFDFSLDPLRCKAKLLNEVPRSLLELVLLSDQVSHLAKKGLFEILFHLEIDPHPNLLEERELLFGLLVCGAVDALNAHRIVYVGGKLV